MSVSVEDCKKVIKNRFELVIIAAYRTKALALGAHTAIVDTKNKGKYGLIALEEIANSKLDINHIKQEIANEYQRKISQLKPYVPQKRPNNYSENNIEITDLFSDDLHHEDIVLDDATECSVLALGGGALIKDSTAKKALIGQDDTNKLKCASDEIYEVDNDDLESED